MNWICNNFSRHALLMLTVFIFIFTTNTATEAEQKVTLVDAIKTALNNNHEIRALKNSLSAQKEEIDISKSQLLPKLTFEERFIRTNNPTLAFSSKLNQERFSIDDFSIDRLNNPKAINDFQTTISFEQPLFVKQADIGIDMSKIEFSAKSEDFKRKKEEITLKVVKTFLMLHTAKEHVQAVTLALDDAKEHLRIATARYNAGLGLYSDVLRASTALKEVEQKLISAQKNLDIAKHALGLLLGMSEPIDIMDETIDIPLMSLDYYKDASLSRKDIKSMEMRLENAKKNVRLAESSILPVIGIGGSYQLNSHEIPFSAEGNSWQVMAFLKWEIFDGTKRNHEKTKAKYKVAEAEEHLSGLKKAVSFKVYEAYLGVEEAKKNVELSRSALKTSEEGKRLVKIRYENSLSPIVDLMDAQANLDHARANLVAKENEYRLSVVNLSYESGTILKDLKIEQ